jgi:hypothetical protein
VSRIGIAGRGAGSLLVGLEVHCERWSAGPDGSFRAW